MTPPAGLIPLTRNEIAHLAAMITQPGRDARDLLRWSTWRRRHQHTARTGHYQFELLMVQLHDRQDLS